MKFNTNSFAVPSLSKTSPDFAAKLKRRDDMQATLARAERKSTELRARLNARRVTATESARAERVAALLGDGIASDGLDSARLSELDRATADMKLALVELDKRVRTARAAASATICAQVEPEHRLRVRAICTKLCELNDAMADYVALADDMDAQDVVWLGLVPSHATFVGRPNDKDSAIGVYLAQAVRDGNLEAKNVPVKLS